MMQFWNGSLVNQAVFCMTIWVAMNPKFIIATMYYTVVHTYSIKGLKQELIAAGYGVSPCGWIEMQFSRKDFFDCLKHNY